MQRFVEDELGRARGLAERTITGLLRRLRDARGSAAHPACAEWIDTLQRQAARFEGAFVESLREQVAAQLRQGGDGRAVAAAGSIGGLELMDESRVDVDIEISRATQLIDTAAEWELRELQTFTSTLIGQAHVSAESNPLRPLVYATALWQAVCTVTPQQAQRAALLRSAADELAGLLKLAWAAACTRLEAQGVEPGVYRTLRFAPGSVAEREPNFDVTQPGALEGLLPNMPSAAAARPAAPRAPAASVPRNAPPAAQTHPDFEKALQRLDALTRQLPAAAPGGAPSAVALLRRLGSEREALVGSASAGVERQIVELVARLFENVVSDARLDPAFGVIIARLQAAALRVALSDPEVLGTYQHPLWQLLDRIGDASAGHPHAHDPRRAALLACCNALADDTAKAGRSDAAPLRAALARLDALLADQLQQQLDAAQPALQALRAAEHRDVLQQSISNELAQRLVRVHTNAVLRRFVTETWAQVLAEAMLRHGEDAEPTLAWLKSTDDLLWSLNTPDHPQSRQRLLGLLPALLQRLRDGMALIGVGTTEQQRVMDELMQVHTQALRPGGRALPATAAEPGPAPRVPAADAEEDAPPFGHSVIDLASMETVPADLLPPAAAPGEGAARPVEALRAGERRRMFVRGEWIRAQLLWRSDRGQYFLFADDTPGRTHSITRRALERLHAAGLVHPLEAKPLVQRAVDGLLRELPEAAGSGLA